MNKIGVVIQVRTGSTRLPNKSILPFYRNKGVFELMLEKLLSAVEIPIIVATTTNSNDDIIVDIVKRFKSVNIFRGSENNVLQRFIEASEQYSLNKIIRVCSDNPFIETYSLKKLINVFSVKELDYLGYCIDGIPSIKTHYGFWAEAVSFDSLVRTAGLTSEQHYIEHVTNFIYSNPEKFKVDFIDSDYIFDSRLRLTMDTFEDFILQKKIFEYFIEIFPDQNYSIRDIQSYLEMKPSFYEHMYLQQLNNTK